MTKPFDSVPTGFSSEKKSEYDELVHDVPVDHPPAAPPAAGGADPKAPEAADMAAAAGPSENTPAVENVGGHAVGVGAADPNAAATQGDPLPADAADHAAAPAARPDCPDPTGDVVGLAVAAAAGAAATVDGSRAEKQPAIVPAPSATTSAPVASAASLCPTERNEAAVNAAAGAGAIADLSVAVSPSTRELLRRFDEPCVQEGGDDPSPYKRSRTDNAGPQAAEEEKIPWLQNADCLTQPLVGSAQQDAGMGTKEDGDEDGDEDEESSVECTVR